MTRSHREKSKNYSFPPAQMRENLIKSVPKNKTEDVPTLKQGVILQQVFSDTECIFKITSDLKTLYVYRYDHVTDTAALWLTFKRGKLANASVKIRKMQGKSTPVHGKIYDIFTIRLNERIYGFELCSREYERLYFLPERRK